MKVLCPRDIYTTNSGFMWEGGGGGQESTKVGVDQMGIYCRVQPTVVKPAQYSPTTVYIFATTTILA